MNTMSRYSILGLSLLTTLACQKTPFTSNATSEDAAANQILNCKTDAGPVDPSQLEIEGAPVAQAGDPISYHLNQDLSCSQSQKVVWKTVGGSGAAKVGSVLKSTFNKAGSYVISAQVESSASVADKMSESPTSTTVISYKTVVVASEVAITGSQVGMVGSPLTYDLAVPAGLNLVSAQWNFGDGSAPVNSLEAVTHTYTRVGSYQVSVTTVDSAQVSAILSLTVSVVPLQDGFECVGDTSISSPSEAVAGVPVSVSVYLPPCLVNKVTAVHWSFGDGGQASNQTVQHTFAQPGDYEMSVQLFTAASGQNAWVILTQAIHVTEASPEQPTPTPTPDSTPVVDNPLACTVAGQTRQSQGELYSETAACGLNGTKALSYRDLITEKCQMSSSGLMWTEVSRDKQLQSEGACQGQSCKLPDGTLLADGAQRVFYSTPSPAGACSAVSETRTCNNGLLSGSAQSQYTTCHNGCDGFGPNGTTKTGVVTGEVRVPVTCAYGETGVVSTYNQVSDQTCQDGQVVSSNTHQGDIKTAGACPMYHWAATDNWTACTADCGGTQDRIYECRNDKNEVAPAERCKDAKPQERRACDGNPDAVKRQESSTAQEDGGSSYVCPANQIGVVVKERDVTTIKNYACIDHQVQLASTDVQYGAWVSESYCRDYVAHRCSQDSLSNSEAQGRLQWMEKCQSQVPVIKEFLTNFAHVEADGSFTLDSSRHLYPTFMNTATKPERPWIAPKSKSSSCQVPSTVYVAAVCVSSCATPEEQILADMKPNGPLKYVPFIDALTRNYGYVATLQNSSSMSSRTVHITKVDQWVTELLDTEHEILVFKMHSGGQLKLTLNHPLLGSDGVMRTADQFKVGEDLVQLGGKRDRIESIEKVPYFGKVYNLFVKSADVAQNVVVTNGYLNGTAFFQNEGAQNLNRALFRGKLTQGVFDK